jgi:hypothetical protein
VRSPELGEKHYKEAPTENAATLDLADTTHSECLSRMFHQSHSSA